MTTVTAIHPGQVRRVLERHGPVDGFTFVLDLDRSSGSWIVDDLFASAAQQEIPCAADSSPWRRSTHDSWTTPAGAA
jgi:hypothetical protein